MTTTANPLLPTYRKATDRYYVALDGVDVGWVLRLSDGWAFYATVRDPLRGERLASGNRTRREAVREGLCMLRIYHLGRVVRLNMDTIRDEPVYFDNLQAVDAALLDQMYPLPMSGYGGDEKP